MTLSKPTLAKGAVICLGISLIGWMLYQAPFVRELLVAWSTKLGPIAVPFVRHAMADSDNHVRMAAYESMKEFGSSAVPSLIRNLEDSNTSVRTEAVRALMVLGPESKSALPVLVEIFRNSNLECRTDIVRAFASIDEKNPSLKSLLLTSLEDPIAEIRKEAAESLGAIYRNGTEMDVVESLTRTVDDTDPAVRAEVCEALGRIGMADAMAILALTKASTDSDSRVRAEAAGALERLKAKHSQ